MHRDPRNFAPHPEAFWPERWLVAAGLEPFPSSTYEGGPKELGFVHNANAFVPFSYGPANCVGKGLGMQEMRTVLSVLLQKMHLHPAEGWDPKEYEARMQEWLIITKPPLPVVVEMRPGSH